MSDWLKRMTDFNQGFFDMPENRLPGAHANLDRKLGNMVSGRGNAEPGEAPGAKGGLYSGIVGLSGLAGGVAGLLLAANFTDSDAFLLGLLILAVGFVLGAIVGAAPLVLLHQVVLAAGEKLLWSRQGSNTADDLIRLWTDRFELAPDPVFVHGIDDDGAAWVLDRKGNFILRMGNGKKLFVGMDLETEPPSLIVRKHGKGRFEIEDAFAMMLAQRSLGRSRIAPRSGNKRHKRLMWAAAKLADMEVTQYTPDAAALQLLDDLRKRTGRSMNTDR